SLRNQLNLALLGLQLAQQQLKSGQTEQAADTLRQVQNRILAPDAAMSAVAGNGTSIPLAPSALAPSALAPPAAPDAARPARPTTPKVTVLVVEDDRGELDLMARLVRSAGFEVATA